MNISYDKLWKLLIDRKLKKKDLRRMTRLSTTTVAKLSHGDTVTTDVLIKICYALNCNLSDIMELTNEETESKVKFRSEIQQNGFNKAVLLAAGIDYDDGVSRCAGNAELYDKILRRYVNDNSKYNQLFLIYDAHDIGALILALRDFMSVAANLSFGDLCKACKNALEAVNNNNIVVLETKMLEIKKAYNDTIHTIISADGGDNAQK